VCRGDLGSHATGSRHEYLDCCLVSSWLVTCLHKTSGNVSREAGILEICYWKCVKERPVHFVKNVESQTGWKCVKRAPLSQEVIKKIIIWGLHNLQSKLERLTVWKHVKRALLSEEIIKKIIICLQSNLKGNKNFCQQSIAEPGSHQENYHLRLALPAFKLKRQSLQSENVLRELCVARKWSRKLSSEDCPTCNQTSMAKSPLCTAFSQVLFLERLGYFYERLDFGLFSMSAESPIPYVDMQLQILWTRKNRLWENRI